MVDEQVAVAHHREDVDGLVVDRLQTGLGDRAPRRVLEVGAVEPVHGPEPTEIDGALAEVDVGIAQVELALQQLEDLRRHVGLDLEAHRPPEAPAAQLELDGLEQILGLLLLEGEVGVAGDPEAVVVARPPSPGTTPSKCAAITCSSGTKRSPSGMTTKRGSRFGTFTRAKRFSPLTGSRTTHGQVERQVGDVGERVARIDGERREHREDAVGEDLVEVRRDRRRRDPGTTSRPSPTPVSSGTRWSKNDRYGLRVRARGRRSRIWSSCSAGVRPSARGLDDAGGDLVLQAGHPHLEELVEVLAEDGEELRPLEQRHVGVLGQRQHPGVEVEPGQLTVQEPVGDSVGAQTRRRRAVGRRRGTRRRTTRSRTPSRRAWAEPTVGLPTVFAPGSGRSGQSSSGRPRSQTRVSRSRSASRTTRSRLRRN